MPALIGRTEEKQLLTEALASPVSEMLAILGRRRIGKTFLVKQTFTRIDFEVTGILNAPMQEQLENFSDKLREAGAPVSEVPGTWLQAFRQLRQWLESKRSKRKKVLFIDELPWMDTPRSRFLEALGHFWNDYAAHNNVLIVLCGSAASWMIRKVVDSKGGLHNRITRLLQLEPFTLRETELFLQAQHIHMDRHQLTQLYMVTGGIPYYLKEVQKGQSVAQTIDRICFGKNGLLTGEFDRLFVSLFDNPDNHLQVIYALASRWKGLTRQDILDITGLSDGGNITRVLEELERSSFISTTQPFGKKKKEMLFRISDPYTLFYLHFMRDRKKSGKGTFLNLVRSPRWTGWCGYAFENICLGHLEQIKYTLGIPAVYTEASGYILKGNTGESGMQIDLLLDRADRVINLCEMKFYDGPFTITKDYAARLRDRKVRFRESTGTRKSIFITMITTFGLAENAYAAELVENQVTLDDLFG
ncbi:MAG: ATP-binding protein [Bacteroidia bacterium]|nr:ATP-binding protein [Bacteroidia bacterium]